MKIQIYDGSNSRYEVPVMLNMNMNQNNANGRLRASVLNSANNQAYFEVKSENTLLLILNQILALN